MNRTDLILDIHWKDFSISALHQLLQIAMEFEKENPDQLVQCRMLSTANQMVMKTPETSNHQNIKMPDRPIYLSEHYLTTTVASAFTSQF